MPADDIFISGVGVYRPPVVSIADAVAEGSEAAVRAESAGLLGVHVAGDTPAPEMALHAAREALARAGQPASELDLQLYADSWHQGPDGWLPQSYLQRHLGGDCLAVEVNVGCNGMFAALELAAAHLRAGAEHGSALVVTADNFGTPLLDRWNSGVGYVPGDGATALVLTRRPSFARVLAARTVTVAAAERVHRGDEPMFPPSVTVGRPLDFGARLLTFRESLRGSPEGAAPLFEVQKQTTEVVRRCLADAGIEVDDVTRVAFNNFSQEMVEQRLMGPLGLPLSKSTWEFGRGIGHGTCDQVMSLDRLLTAGELGPGDHLLMMGVAPGITLSAAVVEIIDAPSWAG
nr:3-oxoacyl-ACP synthase [Micromonospora sp.]